MAVYVSNLIIDQGADFSQTFNLEDTDNSALDLTGYTAIAQMRKHSGSSSFYNFTVSFPSRVGGTVKLTMVDDLTVNLKPGRYIYDILLTDSAGLKERVVEGTVLVREGASKT